MLYLKLFILYSIIGFTFESFIFKINNINKHSGVLHGPYTLVYGLGGTICTLINNYLNTHNYLLLYLLFTITCTLIEFAIGHLIKLIYHIDSWDYSYKKYHLGKYICLNYALIWGLMAFTFTNILHNYFNYILVPIKDKFVIGFTIIILIDIFLTFIQNKK